MSDESKVVRRAIIPAGGLGTRFLPVAKAVPKEMLPILGRPVIDFVVTEAVEAGCSEICIVVTSGKSAIQRYFDTAFELEERLAKAGRLDELEGVRGTRHGASIEFVDQGEPMGLGHAIRCAREFAGEQPFGVLLGDAILRPHAMNRLAQSFARTSRSAVAVQSVDRQLVSRYGIVSPRSDGELSTDRPTEAVSEFRVCGLVEKPNPSDAPSNFAVAARYVFSEKIWTFLDSEVPDPNGEIQITNAMDRLARDESYGGGMFGVEIEGDRYDLGNPIDFLTAEIDFAKRSLDRDTLARIGL